MRGNCRWSSPFPAFADEPDDFFGSEWWVYLDWFDVERWAHRGTKYELLAVGSLDAHFALRTGFFKHRWKLILDLGIREGGHG
jgi:hypothetical protein